MVGTIAHRQYLMHPRSDAIELLAYPGRVGVYGLSYQQFVAYGEDGAVDGERFMDTILVKTPFKPSLFFHQEYLSDFQILKLNLLLPAL
jgi:hypothetical protein